MTENRLSKAVERILRPYLGKIKSEGLKNKISKVLIDKNIDFFILNQVKRHLLNKRVINLGRKLGMVDVQYKRGGIQFDFCGLARLLVKKIVITDDQILYITDNIINQAQEKYINNPDYIIEKMSKILNELSSTGIYKPESPEEKTIYDLALLITANYYKNEEKCPVWVKGAIENLKKGDFIEDWIETILEHICTVISNMSENLYIDFKITFDSFILRSVFKKKTNNGQISKILEILKIDVKNLIYSIAYDYLSPSFIKGSGELLKDIAETFLFDFWKNGTFGEKKNFSRGKSPQISCLTMTPGENPDTQRALRWFTDRKLRLFLEFCKYKDFSQSVSVEASYRCIPFSYPIINLGVITSYKIKKSFQYSVELSDLQREITYYYRIISVSGEILSGTHEFILKNTDEEFETLVLADSQGMVEKDYNTFLQVLNEGVKSLSQSGFIIHMGDFVDDGNNEIYWNWVLNSNLWAENAILPVSGNHEAKLSPAAMKAGVENSIFRHFNLRGLPKQSTDTGVYYSYTLGCALFIVINTNSMDKYLKIDQKQYFWALDTAKNSDAKWKILLTHKSPYSNGPHHSEKDSEEIGKQIIQLAYDAEIDLVIGGHDHVYTRTPSMSWGKCTGHSFAQIKKKGTIYDLFFNPLGTIFIVPGTSGVKNYKLDLNTTFPTEKIIDLNCPVYSKIKVTKNRLYFNAYKYSPLTEKSECIDGIIIEKNSEINKYINSSLTDSSINCISLVPWAPSGEKIKRAFNLFRKLDYHERLSVRFYRKLEFISRLTSKYKDITEYGIEIVKNKSEFLKAVSNNKVKTIITDCSEIKFENRFGMFGKIIINRDLCIRGSAKLLFVNFIVKNNSMLVLGDSVCIDNSRRVLSFYLQLNAVEIRDNSCFIMLDYASIRCSGGTGFKAHGIYISGREAGVFLNTKSESFSSGEFIFSVHSNSYIFIEEGKYFSLGSSYTVLASGKVEISGGKISGIKLLPSAKGEMYAGTITSLNKKAPFVPVYCQGEFKIYGGNIKSGSEPSVTVTGWCGKIYALPDHKGAVKINGRDIFIGEIICLADNKIKVELTKKNINNGYENISLYSSYKQNIYENLDKLKLEAVKIKNGDIFKIQEGHKNLVIMSKIYDNIMKPSITVKDGGIFCLLSKPCFINKLKKSGEINEKRYKN